MYSLVVLHLEVEVGPLAEVDPWEDVIDLLVVEDFLNAYEVDQLGSPYNLGTHCGIQYWLFLFLQLSLLGNLCHILFTPLEQLLMPILGYSKKAI